MPVPSQNNLGNPYNADRGGLPVHSPYGLQFRAALLHGILNFQRESILVPGRPRDGGNEYNPDFGVIAGSVRWPAQVVYKPTYPGLAYISQQGGYDKPQPWQR